MEHKAIVPSACMGSSSVHFPKIVFIIRRLRRGRKKRDITPFTSVSSIWFHWFWWILHGWIMHCWELGGFLCVGRFARLCLSFHSHCVRGKPLGGPVFPLYFHKADPNHCWIQWSTYVMFYFFNAQYLFIFQISISYWLFFFNLIKDFNIVFSVF